MIYPRLYKKDSKGKIRFWELQIEHWPTLPHVHRITVTGILNESSKSNIKKIEPSKVAKALPRATKLCNTEWDKKLRLGYFQSVEEAQTNEPPKVKMLVKDMLPADIEKMRDDEFPIYIQEKINGLAGTYHHDKGEILSRELKVFDRVPALTKACSLHCEETGLQTLDFEMFALGRPINEQVSLVKGKVTLAGKGELRCYVFDLPMDDEPFSYRNQLMSYWKQPAPTGIKYVRTILAKNKEQVRNFYESVLEAGGEGIIIRTADGLYKWNNKTTRDDRIRKVKPLISEEFKIVGIEYEERIVASETKRLITWICETHDGKHKFTVPPTSWGVEKRVLLYSCSQHQEFRISELAPLTIEFREWTKTMKPFHIVETVLRNYE